MGLIRKAMSVGTLGVVDLRSDKERIARSSRKASKELKTANQISKTANQIAKRNAKTNPMTPPPLPPASLSVADELTKLAALREQGAITDAEFAAQKARLLS